MGQRHQGGFQTHIPWWQATHEWDNVAGTQDMGRAPPDSGGDQWLPPRYTSWTGRQEGRCGPGARCGQRRRMRCVTCRPAETRQITGRGANKHLYLPAQHFPNSVPKDTGSVRHLSSNKFRNYLLTS